MLPFKLLLLGAAVASAAPLESRDVTLTAEEIEGLSNGTFKWRLVEDYNPVDISSRDVAPISELPSNPLLRRQNPTSMVNIGLTGTFDCNTVKSITRRLRATVVAPISMERLRQTRAQWTSVENINGFRPGTSQVMDRDAQTQANTVHHQWCWTIDGTDLQCAYYMEARMVIQFNPDNLAILSGGASAPTLKEICLRSDQCPSGILRGCELRNWGPA